MPVLAGRLVYFLSSAVGKHASLKKSVSGEKNSETSKETWFDLECKNLFHERQVTYEEYSRISISENWSITTLFSKTSRELPETSLHRQMKYYTETMGLLTPTPFGFGRKVST